MEQFDVVIIGAGLSGIGAARYLQERCPWASFTVLEARDAIGGTWDLFRYPGVRSDSDMYTLGYSFKPWPGDKSLADGPSILSYVREAATETGVDRAIRFGHRVVAADWSSDEACWTVTAERTDTGDPVTISAGFVFSCTGYYRYDRGHQPDFPGSDRFAGTLVHPQHWPADLDHAGKRVVVIGSGATAVTLVPAMADTAAHVTMLQRSPTYIASVPQRDVLALAVRKYLRGPKAGPVIRWIKAILGVATYTLSRRRPETVKKLLRKGLVAGLPADYDIDTHFTPAYDPWDQRMCAIPDGDLFAAIREGKASVVTDHIDTFTETGIRLRSGTEIEADIVVSATGLDLLFLGGMVLSVDGQPVDVASRLVYKGMMLEGVPNMAIAVGYTNASWTLKVDLTCDYVCRLLTKLRASGMRQATPVNTDPSVVAEPLLNLTSGYITRAADRFPRSGTKAPWKVHMNYLTDYRTLKLKGIDDPALHIGNPAPPTTTVAGRRAGAARDAEATVAAR
ncbi:MAG TPA: NAD(P)/FAD-dependent oxidoreductase [Acidimicrobiales bacterium]|nr:NAD(P)/FAD-dependent oxidoreductase [Acidimicrobiales bacterium]